MRDQIFSGAPMKCSFGTSPTNLVVFRIPDSSNSNQIPANIMDFRPFANIPTFGMCTSPANPLVIVNTVAAMGAMTPAPCIPSTTIPWTHWSNGPSQVMVEKAPALDKSCSLHCTCGGRIDFI